MNKVWTFLHFPLPRSSLTEQGRLFLRLSVSMDDKQIFRGVTGDGKEEDDEIFKSQYSQTAASESDAEAADGTGTFNRGMWRTLQWEMEQRCLIFQDLLLKSTVSQNTFPLRTWNCLQLKSLWLWRQIRQEVRSSLRFLARPFCCLLLVLFFYTEATAVEHDVQIHFKSGSTTPVYICTPCSVERHQPKPLHSLLPPFTENRKLPDVSQTLTKTRVQDSLKTSSAHTEADGSGKVAGCVLVNIFYWCLIIRKCVMFYINHVKFYVIPTVLMVICFRILHSKAAGRFLWPIICQELFHVLLAGLA